jgi:hypothetical protein
LFRAFALLLSLLGSAACGGLPRMSLLPPTSMRIFSGATALASALPGLAAWRRRHGADGTLLVPATATLLVAALASGAIHLWGPHWRQAIVFGSDVAGRSWPASRWRTRGCAISRSTGRASACTCARAAWTALRPPAESHQPCA